MIPFSNTSFSFCFGCLQQSASQQPAINLDSVYQIEMSIIYRKIEQTGQTGAIIFMLSSLWRRTFHLTL
ncbi:unnamed protein product [Caenorhabditis nigoni]